MQRSESNVRMGGQHRSLDVGGPARDGARGHSGSTAAVNPKPLTLNPKP